MSGQNHEIIETADAAGQRAACTGMLKSGPTATAQLRARGHDSEFKSAEITYLEYGNLQGFLLLALPFDRPLADQTTTAMADAEEVLLMYLTCLGQLGILLKG